MPLPCLAMLPCLVTFLPCFFALLTYCLALRPHCCALLPWLIVPVGGGGCLETFSMILLMT